MKQYEIDPNDIFLTAMVSAGAKHARQDFAAKYFQEMERLKITPNNYTFSAIINAFAKKGKLDKVTKYINKVKVVLSF
jgi:pentatricopeptide repeat protein